MEITEGKRLAKLLLCRMGESPEKKTPYVEASFEFTENGKREALCYAAFLTEETIKFQRPFMINVLGWNQSREIDPTTKVFTDPKAFAYGKEVEIEVVIEENTANNGTIYRNPKIKSVRNIGGGNFVGISPERVKSAFDLLGAKPAGATSKSTAHIEPQFNSEETLPF